MSENTYYGMGGSTSSAAGGGGGSAAGAAAQMGDSGQHPKVGNVYGDECPSIAVSFMYQYICM